MPAAGTSKRWSTSDFLGETTSLALETGGQPHISYQDQGFLYHAYRDAGGWHTQRLDYGGSHQSLALSQDGRAHISYNSGSGDNDLKYALQAENTLAWSYVTVESEGTTGWATALAVASDGFAHIRYYKVIAQGDDYINGELRYAYLDASGWHVEVVDHEGDVGEYAALAIDAQGAAHLSFFDSTFGDLKAASQESSGWITHTVDSAGTVGLWTSLALDGDAYPHISYFDATRSDLKYAYQDASGWYTQTIDVGDVSPGTAIALDTSGYGRISYAKAGYLVYAMQDASGWYTETTGIASSGYPSMELDDDGYPHIVHSACDYTYQDIGGWHSQFVDSGAYCDLALDSAGYPHISYYASGVQRDLKYAYQNIGGWHVLSLDTSGDVGLFTSIALDSAGGVNISYYDSSNRELEYFYGFGGTWYTQTVDDFGDVGRYSALALDPDGLPRIAYYDDTHHGLEFASLVPFTSINFLPLVSR